MVKPLTCAPVIDHLGAVSGDGGAGQMSDTLPLIAPPAEPLCSNTLPFDQTSPTTVVVELPWKVNELPPPGHPAGLRVWIAAPLVPVRRATAVAVVVTVMVLPEPSTCMMVTGMRWVAVTVKVVPAIEWSATVCVMTWLVESLNEHET